MTNHPTRLGDSPVPDGEIELVTWDAAVRHKAHQALESQAVLDFVFWNGQADEIVEGVVTACDAQDPLRFRIRRTGAQSGGAAGPHDTPDQTTAATKGGGMLPEPGNASDNDMAPGG